MSSQVTMASPINQFWTGRLTGPMGSERKGTTGQRWRAGFDDAGENNKSAKNIFRKADGRQAIPVGVGIKTLGVVLFLSLAGLSSPQRAQAQTTINICDRTPQIEAKILKALSKTEADCGSVTPAELAGIRTLTVEEDKSLTALQAGDFDDLTSLKVLDLGGNSLSSLPAGVFDKLTRLERLDLYYNNLGNLPAGVFDKLTSLGNLDLGLNSLSSLPAGVFDRLTSLKMLDLVGNSLSSLPAGVFDKPTSLVHLNLGLNSLSSLPAGVFDRLTSLRLLALGGNNLSGLPAGIFDKLTGLGNLDLKDNSLSSLRPGDFDDLTSLRVLALGDNSLSSLPAGVFDKLTRLEKLDLYNNNLSGLPAGVFDKLTSLVLLDLKGNSLSSLRPGVFDDLTSLTHLNLHNNSLSSLAMGIFDKLTNLKQVYLTHNSLTCLPPLGLSISDLRLDKPKSSYQSCGVFIAESGDSTWVNEAAGTKNTDTYTVVLASEPTASVSIEVTSGDPGAATVSPATLTFSTSDWNSGQTVTVTGVDDKLSQSNSRRAAISHSATSTDSAYDGISIPSVTVSVAGGPGVRIAESDGSTRVRERSGINDSYTVVLQTQPTAPVRISISIKFNGNGNPFYRIRAKASPATLTFNPSTWSRPQTVTVTGLDDGWHHTGRHDATFRHTATSTDPDYHNIQISSVDVFVEDVDGLQDGDNTRALESIIIRQSDGNTSVTEGGTDT